MLAGAYFVTVCTHRRVCLFGQAADGEMRLNGFGAIVEACWRALPRHYLHVRLDAFVVMPNHVHAIVVLTDDTASAPPNLKRSDLSEIVRAFKTFSSRRVNQHRGTRGIPVWQRGYHDRIIRDEASLREVRAYIERNPPRWDLDRENPVNAQRDFGTEGGFETRPYVKPSNAATGGRTRSPLVIL